MPHTTHLTALTATLKAKYFYPHFIHKNKIFFPFNQKAVRIYNQKSFIRRKVKGSSQEKKGNVT